MLSKRPAARYSIAHNGKKKPGDISKKKGEGRDLFAGKKRPRCGGYPI